MLNYLVTSVFLKLPAGFNLPLANRRLRLLLSPFGGLLGGACCRSLSRTAFFWHAVQGQGLFCSASLLLRQQLVKRHPSYANIFLFIVSEYIVVCRLR